MSDSLTGSSVLVVGGTGTIGRAVARAAVAVGGDVTLTSRDGGRARQVAQELGATGVACDPASHDDVVALSERGPWDHLVLAQAALSFASAAEIGHDELHALVASKLTDAIWLVRHLAPQVQRSVIQLSGMLSRSPAEQGAPLAAVNGAVEALGRALALELAPRRSLVVSPGALGRAGPDGHEGTADDVAALVVHAMTNPWLNGTVLDLHGATPLQR